MQVRLEEVDDHAAVRHLHETAFQGDGEARLVDVLRSEGFARLSLVAAVDGIVVGHILFSELSIVLPDRVVSALSLAPVAVLPDWHRQGIGSVLIEQGLALCRAHGHAIVIVLGNPQFYQRFGFSTELAKPLQSEYAGDYFMALELVPGALQSLQGRVEYSPPFAAL